MTIDDRKQDLIERVLREHPVGATGPGEAACRCDHVWRTWGAYWVHQAEVVAAALAVFEEQQKPEHGCCLHDAKVNERHDLVMPIYAPEPQTEPTEFHATGPARREQKLDGNSGQTVVPEEPEAAEVVYFTQLDGDYAEESATLAQAEQVRREAFGRIPVDERKITKRVTYWLPVEQGGE